MRNASNKIAVALALTPPGRRGHRALFIDADGQTQYA